MKKIIIVMVIGLGFGFSVKAGLIKTNTRTTIESYDVTDMTPEQINKLIDSKK